MKQMRRIGAIPASTQHFIWIGLGIGMVYWVIESWIHVQFFNQGHLVDELMRPDYHEIWKRALVIGLLVVISAYAQYSINIRRRAEAAMHDREQDLQSAHAELDQIFQTASVGLRVVGRDFKVLKINQTFADMTQVDENDAVGKKCYDVFAGSKCATDGCPLKLILGGRPRVECHVIKHRADGTNIPCILTATPFTGPDGRITGIVESFRDITALKNAQDAMGLERDKLERILSHLTEGVCIVNHDHIIEYQNAALEEQIGKAEGNYCYRAFRQAGASCEPCLMQKALASGQVQQHEFETPDARCFERTYTPIIDVDEETKVVVLLRDLTDKKASQAAIMRAEQLAALGELAAGVAHEINNPINGIINYAQLAVNKNKDRELVTDVAERIIHEGNRIARIVEGLLSFAQRKNEGKMPFSVKAIVSESLILTSAQMRKDNIAVLTDISPGLPHVMGQDHAVEQVFVNIISNAIHALNQRYPGSHEDKRLEITAETVDANRRPGVRISFLDRGTGIPADIINKVHNPFFSTKTEGKRTGLGLSISHGIVKDHGGELTIESVEGEFTCVRVDLPAEPEIAS